MSHDGGRNTDRSVFQNATSVVPTPSLLNKITLLVVVTHAVVVVVETMISMCVLSSVSGTGGGMMPTTFSL